jgi:hypothetical protein
MVELFVRFLSKKRQRVDSLCKFRNKLARAEHECKSLLQGKSGAAQNVFLYTQGFFGKSKHRVQITRVAAHFSLFLYIFFQKVAAGGVKKRFKACCTYSITRVLVKNAPCADKSINKTHKVYLLIRNINDNLLLFKLHIVSSFFVERAAIYSVWSGL